MTERLFNLADVEPDPPTAPPKLVSVTGLVTYALCPKRFFWSDIDRLPRRRNSAAVAGTELHRRIELFHRGQVPFEEVHPDMYDAPDVSSGPGGFTAFKASRFATAQPALVEAPFELALGNGFKVRGRIDAVYETHGSWEVVDFKSGRNKVDDSRLVQLQAYAMAVTDVDFGLPSPTSIDVVFAYLGGGLEEEKYRADTPWIESARSRVEQLTDDISLEKFGEHPGEWCSHCDFAQFCAIGQEWLSSQ